MEQQKDRYLYVSHSAERVGMASKIRDLEFTIKLALSTNRIPIIGEGGRDAMYAQSARGRVIDWQRYIDLSQTRIFKVESGHIKELADTLQYRYEGDFDFRAYAKNQIRRINGDQLYDEENKHYPIIYLLHTEAIRKSLRATPRRPINSTINPSTTSRLSTHSHRSFWLILPPSREVNGLSDIVLNHFGAKRSDLKFLADALYPSYRVNQKNLDRCSKYLNYYACIDTRLEENAGVFTTLAHKFTVKRKTEEVVRKILSGRGHHKPQLPCYILSNLRDAHYFDSLKSKYNIYRYTDFKELRERVAQEEDLLYMVENNIMRYALVKGLPGRMNRFAFEGPWRQGTREESGMERFYFALYFKKFAMNYIPVYKALQNFYLRRREKKGHK